MEASNEVLILLTSACVCVCAVCVRAAFGRGDDTGCCCSHMPAVMTSLRNRFIALSCGSSSPTTICTYTHGKRRLSALICLLRVGGAAAAPTRCPLADQCMDPWRCP